MFIQTEATPNPEVLKFLPGRDVLGAGTREFRDAIEGAASPLASALFGVDGVNRVFFGPDFLTVTKSGERDWAHLKAPILAEIMDYYTSAAPLMDDSAEAGHADDETVYEGETAQIVAEIKDLLDTRIRPAVAQDGGDILFFEVRAGHRRRLAAHARRLLRLPVVLGDLESGRGKHAQALRP